MMGLRHSLLNIKYDHSIDSTAHAPSSSAGSANSLRSVSFRETDEVRELVPLVSQFNPHIDEASSTQHLFRLDMINPSLSDQVLFLTESFDFLQAKCKLREGADVISKDEVLYYLLLNFSQGNKVFINLFKKKDLLLVYDQARFTEQIVKKIPEFISLFKGELADLNGHLDCSDDELVDYLEQEVADFLNNILQIAATVKQCYQQSKEIIGHTNTLLDRFNLRKDRSSTFTGRLMNRLNTDERVSLGEVYEKISARRSEIGWADHVSNHHIPKRKLECLNEGEKHMIDDEKPSIQIEKVYTYPILHNLVNEESQLGPYSPINLASLEPVKEELDELAEKVNNVLLG